MSPFPSHSGEEEEGTRHPVRAGQRPGSCRAFPTASRELLMKSQKVPSLAQRAVPPSLESGKLNNSCLLNRKGRQDHISILIKNSAIGLLGPSSGI